jgi:hypothetical protein
MPGLRGYAGVGAGWCRIFAPRLTSSALDTRERSGTALELGAVLGLSFDVVENWLSVGASARAAWATAHGGDVFDSTQAFDSEGRRTTLNGLPKYAGAISALVSAELLL